MKRLLVLLILFSFSVFLSACTTMHNSENTAKASQRSQKVIARKPVQRVVNPRAAHNNPPRSTASYRKPYKNPYPQVVPAQKLVNTAPIAEPNKKKKKKKKKKTKVKKPLEQKTSIKKTSKEEQEPTMKITSKEEQEDAKASEQDLTEIISE